MIKYKYYYIAAPNFGTPYMHPVTDDTPIIYFRYFEDQNDYLPPEEYSGIKADFNYFKDQDAHLYGNGGDIKDGYLVASQNWNEYSPNKLIIDDPKDGKPVGSGYRRFNYDARAYFLSDFFNGPLLASEPGAGVAYQYGYNINSKFSADDDFMIRMTVPIYTFTNLVEKQFLYYSEQWGVGKLGYYHYDVTEPVKAHKGEINQFIPVKLPGTFTPSNLPNKFQPVKLPPKVEVTSTVNELLNNEYPDDPDQNKNYHNYISPKRGFTCTFNIDFDAVKNT